jgi:integrase
MAIHRLTPRELNKIEAAKPTRTKLYSDGGGLNLQVGEGGGAKSWIFRYSLKPFGKPGERRMGLGAAHTISIDEAREQARICRQQILKGIDPWEAREAAKISKRLEESKRVTFGFCAADYLTAKAKEGLRPNSLELIERMIRLYLNPSLNDVPVAAIDHQQMYRILDPIWHSKSGTADKVREYAAAIFDRATAHGFRTGDNPASAKGPLGILLGPLGHTHKPFVSLPYPEIGTFMAKLRAFSIVEGRPRRFPELAQIKDSVYAKLIEFIILTAVRSSQAVGMKWEEIDWDNKVWTCPWQRTKTGRKKHTPHEIHLSKPALAVLRYMQAMQKEQGVPPDRVFTGNRADKIGKTLDYRGAKMFLTKVLRPALDEQIEFSVKFTIHGFRTTFSSWANDNNFQREAIEMALDHVVGSQIERLYARNAKRWKERIRLLDAWADFCGRTETLPAEVIPLRQHK